MFDLDLISKPVDLEAGEWVDNIPGHPGMRLKVRSKNIRAFETAHNNLLRGFSGTGAEILASDDYNIAAGKLIAAHILVDWENALVVKGKPVAYDPALALQILTSVDNRKIGDAFRNAVANASAEVADRHLGIVKAIVGN